MVILYSTHIDEKDVIMGTTKRIEEALLEIDREYKPKYIFVVGSSIASVIATDLKGICSSMEDSINAKMIAFEGGGFRGDYTLGLREALNALVKTIVKPCDSKKANVFNIIGATSEEYRIRSNVEEIKSIMKECFNFELGTCFTLDSSIEEIENSGEAALNLVIRNEGIEAANILKEKTNTPFLYGAPYGYIGTLSWIEEVGKLINRPPSLAYISKVRKKMISSKQFHMYKHFISTPLKACIVGNYDMIVGLSKFFKEDIGFDIGFGICNHSIKKCNNEDENIRYFDIEKDKINVIKDCSQSILLGDDVTLAISSEDNVKVKVSNPTLGGREFLTHMPFMGYKGADYLLEEVSKYINKHMQGM